VRGIVTGSPWPERLRDAVALSAAAVLHPVAGGFDAGAYRRLLDLVEVRPLPPAEPAPATARGKPACR
jgi:tagatose 6-phosphate kinase